MFDLIVSGHRNTTRRDLGPLLVSWTLHAAAIGAVVLVSVLYASDQLPALPREVLTYVTVTAPPPPPPPPAPPPAAAPAVKRTAPAPKPTPTAVPKAPVEPPRELPVSSELAADGPSAGPFASFDGVPGGVEGGIPGGVLGGIVGGLADVDAPPPPPPPAVRPPIRAGGQIQAPELITRVPPVYPPLAVNAGVEGIVILEATVGRDGRVEQVEVLRSVPLLDKAAVEAVRQWVYAPLHLNGQAERFILTVTVSFNLT